MSAQHISNADFVKIAGSFSRECDMNTDVMLHILQTSMFPSESLKQLGLILEKSNETYQIWNKVLKTARLEAGYLADISKYFKKYELAQFILDLVHENRDMKVYPLE